MTEQAITRPIRFAHRGAIVEVDDVPTTMSVLVWLRERARLVGTKEGCNEGDCGACMVIVGELESSAPDGVALRPANACLTFMASLDGRALFTVEDLKRVAREAAEPCALHPAQQAMLEHHGSQCGFCTPGFAMSLAACYDDHVRDGTRPSRSAVADALSGNLCRCTGYRPILDAGLAMFDAPLATIDRAAIATLLRTLVDDPPLSYRAPEHALAGEEGRESAWVAAPRDVDALASLYLEHPDARLVAGATDVGLWSTKQFKPLGKLIRVDAVDALKDVAARDDVLSIGAGASLEAAWDALVAHVPSLDEMKRRFASRSLRLMGTMGGNVANGSPIGDSAPVLLALDAVLLLRRGSRQRRMALADFQRGYMVNALQPGEWIAAIEVPLPDAVTHVRAYKMSKRFDCDISAVSAAFAVRVVDGRVGHARFAFGGMAAVCKRASKSEAAVFDCAWDAACIDAAVAAIASDFAPIDDLRASAAYRVKVAGNLLRRFWLETREADALPRERVSVWPRGVVAA